MKYAAQTSVSTDRSRMEIEQVVKRYGAEEFAYMSGSTKAVVGFRLNQRMIRFDLPIPKLEDFQMSVAGRQRTDSQMTAHAEQAARQRWRALLLAIKAKLEAVESGIATFESEFLAYFVMADGVTVGERLVPQLEEATRSRAGHLLLSGPEPRKDPPAKAAR
jgi:acetyl-CoA carboxylase beta subunit